MKIYVDCENPKYVSGKYEFDKLEELFKFFMGIKGFPRGNIGSFLLTIAKDGSISGPYTSRYGFKITSDIHDYMLAKKLANETKLIDASDKVNWNLDTTLDFAKAFDKEVAKVH